MKATWKKSAAVLMALTVVVAACGDDDDEAGGEATAEGTAEATAEARQPPRQPPSPPPKQRGKPPLPVKPLPPVRACSTERSRASSSTPARRSRSCRRLATATTTRTSSPDYIDAYQPLIDCTGVEITWSGTDQFETEVNVRLEGGNPPDVIDFPQPGLLEGERRGRIPVSRCPRTSPLT